MNDNIKRVQNIIDEERKLRKLRTKVEERSEKYTNTLYDLMNTAKHNVEEMKICNKKLQDLQESNEQLRKLLEEEQKTIENLREANNSLEKEYKLMKQEMSKQHENYLLEIDRLRLMKKLSGVFLMNKPRPNMIEGVIAPTGTYKACSPFSLDESKENVISPQGKFHECVGYSPHTIGWMRLLVPQFPDNG